MAKRIFDTGIRELTIMGQGIGLAMRGLRPIAEIQYLDYLLYGLQPLSDDVATLHYQNNRTAKLSSDCSYQGPSARRHLAQRFSNGNDHKFIRGMYVCVPRNMTQAVGMYNTIITKQ